MVFLFWSVSFWPSSSRPSGCSTNTSGALSSDLGRIIDVKGPGLIFLIPVIDKMVRVSLRTITMDVPPQDVITRDNVSVKVNAVVYFRVMDPNKAIVEVENYMYATSQLAQTTLRSILGQEELDDMLAEREKINNRIQEVLDKNTDPWGVKVSHVEIKHIDLPQEMQRAIARQAEAERIRRAKVINADGEFQASAKLAEAADVLGKNPIALAAAVSADPGGDRHGEQLHHDLPDTHRHF